MNWSSSTTTHFPRVAEIDVVMECFFLCPSKVQAHRGIEVHTIILYVSGRQSTICSEGAHDKLGTTRCPVLACRLLICFFKPIFFVHRWLIRTLLLRTLNQFSFRLYVGCAKKNCFGWRPTNWYSTPSSFSFSLGARDSKGCIKFKFKHAFTFYTCILKLPHFLAHLFLAQNSSNFPNMQASS